MAPGPGDIAEEETDNWVGSGQLSVEVTRWPAGGCGFAEELFSVGRRGFGWWFGEFRGERDLIGATGT